MPRSTFSEVTRLLSVEPGSAVTATYMMFSFRPLAVIPALRLANRAVVDGIEFALVAPRAG